MSGFEVCKFSLTIIPLAVSRPAFLASVISGRTPIAIMIISNSISLEEFNITLLSLNFLTPSDNTSSIPLSRISLCKNAAIS